MDLGAANIAASGRSNELNYRFIRDLTDLTPPLSLTREGEALRRQTDAVLMVELIGAVAPRLLLLKFATQHVLRSACPFSP